MKTSYFYTDADIKKMKEMIRTGQPLLQIARREHQNFNSTLFGFYQKLYKVAKTTYKIAEWTGPKLERGKSFKTVSLISKPATEAEMPEGFTFEGTPKKVTFCVDHFRVYF